MPIINYTFRLDKALKEKLKRDAKKHGRSLNAHAHHILEEYVKGNLVPVKDLTTDPRVKAFVKSLKEIDQ